MKMKTMSKSKSKERKKNERIIESDTHIIVIRTNNMDISIYITFCYQQTICRDLTVIAIFSL